MEKAHFGMVGLGVMGQNLALNIADKGYLVAVYNRTDARTQEFLINHPDQLNIIGTYSYEELVEKLVHPRKIMLMIKAGPAVDKVIDTIKPYLVPGDILIDGGNSYFKDTERRNEILSEDGLLYLGTGVSGGEEGALHGPSIMPGGDWDAWEAVKDIFTSAAAKAEDGEPCVDFMGLRGAGHYVKTVHNGIEYAIMQLIGEVYDLLHRGAGVTNQELGILFDNWNAGELSSYLVEITAEIFKTKDLETGQPILDVILDEAKQKGTGKWTSQDAFDLGAPTHTINAAVSSRIMSGMKEQRLKASQILNGPESKYIGDCQQLINATKEALYAGVIIAYAQGFGLMQLASEEYGYNLDMKIIAKIWRAGCIIRASLLDEIMHVFDNNPRLVSILMDDFFCGKIVPRQGALRYVITSAIGMGIPVYAMSAGLGYFDALRTARLPANLTQAQRDFFGAHTYRRVDKEGSFHTAWQG